jgi:hypothetical protein
MYFLNTTNKTTLTSSNAPVENYPNWDSSSTYNTGEKVIHNNKIWESTIDSNNTEPADDNINWAFISYTNPYKCIDEYINTQTISDNDIVMEFSINKTNGIALLNVEASEIIVEVYDKDNNLITIKNESAIIDISSWGDYFFNDLEYKNKFFIELPFLFTGKIILTIKKTSIAKVGVVLIGFSQDLGITLKGIKTGIDDYSKKVIDNNGNVFLKQGSYRDVIDCKVVLKNTDFNTTKQKLIKLRAIPILYLATEDEKYRELLLYGYYENFDFTINSDNYSELNLTLRGIL